MWDLRPARLYAVHGRVRAGGNAWPAAAQRFVYVLNGTVDLATEASFNTLTDGGYAYLPAGLDCTLTAQGTARVAVIEKNYQPLAGRPRRRFWWATRQACFRLP